MILTNIFSVSTFNVRYANREQASISSPWGLKPRSSKLLNWMNRKNFSFFGSWWMILLCSFKNIYTTIFYSPMLYIMIGKDPMCSWEFWILVSYSYSFYNSLLQYFSVFKNTSRSLMAWVTDYKMHCYKSYSIWSFSFVLTLWIWVSWHDS